ncbi:DoxX family protein [Rhodohalobacter sulfatireducens]|uniref:DoxX family protein n=1 Tax=Rhodohalobacter sulfatireducens TaxID=2911366 RepID=A0ABS9KFL6_9BACT|nr:DoxX family protein [Rhodohalobacter sulfatireducens]MCG2589652.1 DoxX family protein [Rhodohalobacter sulfatireducens]
MANLDNKYGDLAILLLRIGVGVIFIVAGWGKLTGIEGVQGFFGNVGIPLPGIMAWVVALVEFFGGIMVLFGAYTKIPYLLLAFTMLVAIFMVKLPDGFSGLRLELMLLLASLALFFIGNGNYSVDHKIANR